MYHFNDEEKLKLFIRKLPSPFFIQPVRSLPRDRMLMLFCSQGKVWQWGRHCMHSYETPTEYFELRAWWGRQSTLYHVLQSLILKLLKEPCPFSRSQRSWTSQLTYCISSCWPGKKSELITLLCSINLDKKLGTNTVWHKSVNQTKTQGSFCLQMYNILQT